MDEDGVGRLTDVFAHHCLLLFLQLLPNCSHHLRPHALYGRCDLQWCKFDWWQAWVACRHRHVHKHHASPEHHPQWLRQGPCTSHQWACCCSTPRMVCNSCASTVSAGVCVCMCVCAQRMQVDQRHPKYKADRVCEVVVHPWMWRLAERAHSCTALCVFMYACTCLCADGDRYHAAPAERQHVSSMS